MARDRESWRARVTGTEGWGEARSRVLGKSFEDAKQTRESYLAKTGTREKWTDKIRILLT